MKNIDIVNSIISKKINIKEDIVKAVNKYYWKQGVKRKLVHMEANSVFVKGFGTFTASRYNIRKLILRTIFNIRNVRSSIKYKETTKIEYIDSLMKRLKLLLTKRNELAKFYYECTNGVFKADTNSVK